MCGVPRPLVPATPARAVIGNGLLAPYPHQASHGTRATHLIAAHPYLCLLLVLCGSSSNATAPPPPLPHTGSISCTTTAPACCLSQRPPLFPPTPALRDKVGFGPCMRTAAVASSPGRVVGSGLPSRHGRHRWLALPSVRQKKSHTQPSTSSCAEGVMMMTWRRASSNGQ